MDKTKLNLTKYNLVTSKIDKFNHFIYLVLVVNQFSRLIFNTITKK
jgi:hypothetical protein